MIMNETDEIRKRYARRQTGGETNRYSLLNASTWQGVLERQRAILYLFRELGITDPSDLKLLEVGCGTGGNLLEFLRLGFRASNMKGLELLDERVAIANESLPKGMVEQGDALDVPISDNSTDILLLSTVFSSLLDPDYQEKLAGRLWNAVKPGGGILWYDFIYDNPSNPDVRGVPVKRIRELFPHGTMITRRVTLAPPLSRFVTRLHPSLYNVFNCLPFLRTHVLCWIGKASDTDSSSASQMPRI
jgi:SAM-dependent methyltransferase